MAMAALLSNSLSLCSLRRKVMKLARRSKDAHEAVRGCEQCKAWLRARESITFGCESASGVAFEELLDHIAPARARVWLRRAACSIEQIWLLHIGAPNRDKVCGDRLADGLARLVPDEGGHVR